MEVEASRLPLKIEKTDQPPALALEIAYQRLVFDIEHAQGKNLAPMRCQALGFEISSGAIRKVVREDQLSRRELLEIAGEADVTGVAPAEYDACRGEERRDHPELEDVVGQLVDHPMGAAADGGQAC